MIFKIRNITHQIQIYLENKNVCYRYGKSEQTCIQLKQT